jgi:biopolymer transport protein ExbD
MRATRTRTEDASFDLNLAPMLDIIVSIIPLLLLSTVFINITILESPIPQPVAKAMANDRQNRDKDFSIAVFADKERGFLVRLSDHGKTEEIQVALSASNLDFSGLHKEMVKIKQRYPDTFRFEFHPAAELKYDEIVGVLDAVRNRDAKDPLIHITEEGTSKQVQVDLLFPDVVFANVSENTKGG